MHPRGLAHIELLRIIKLEGDKLCGTLIDIGCGKKPYKKDLPHIHTYIGIDLPDSMHGLSNVDIVGDSMHLPLANEIADSILCTEVLEHTPYPQNALKEISRVLKPGGKLLLTVPFSEQLHEEPYDFFRFTPYSLQLLLSQSGLKILRMHRRGGAWLEIGYRLSSLIYCTIGATKKENGALQPKFILGPIAVLSSSSKEL